jgi:hypothetical protein
MFGSKSRPTFAVLAATAALAGSVAVLSLGLSAAPADAAIGRLTTSLTVNPYIPGTSTVRFSGVVSMSQAEAQGLINSGHRVQWRMWGDDPVSDDRLLGPLYADVSATPRGLEFSRFFHARHTMLDEDDSRLDDRDELYVGVRLINSAGATIRSGETNRKIGHY